VTSTTILLERKRWGEKGSELSIPVGESKHSHWSLIFVLFNINDFVILESGEDAVGYTSRVLRKHLPTTVIAQI